MERNEYTVDLTERRTEDISDTTQGFSYLLACVICLALALFFLLNVIVRRGKVPVVQLQTRINPNNAPVASLVRLPQIGLTRAEKIIVYRLANTRDKSAFKRFDDLQKVRGIGPVIAAGLSDYLMFDNENRKKN